MNQTLEQILNIVASHTCTVATMLNKEFKDGVKDMMLGILGSANLNNSISKIND